LKQAASDKTEDLKEKASGWKQAAVEKTQELKDKAAVTLEQGKEYLNTSTSGPAEAAKEHGGSLTDKTRVFAEETAAPSSTDGSFLKEGDVRKALDEQKKVEEGRHEGLLSSMIHWMFRGGEPTTTSSSSSNTTTATHIDEITDEEYRYNQKLERLNSVAYSPAIGSTYDAPLEVSAKEISTVTSTASSLPIETTQTTTFTTSSLFEEDLSTKTSASSSYFQPYSTEQEKKEVEERVLEQTIDFFY